MIYDPSEHPFHETHKLMIGSILPRPIALVSTISKNKCHNIAPFSYFNGVCSNPPTVMFAPARRGWDGEEKDTLVNIRDTGEFVINIVSESIGEQMVMCSTDYEPDIDEFSISGFTAIESNRVKCARVLESKISFECQLNQIIEIGDGSAGSGFIVIGEIILFHINDEIYNQGHIDSEKLKPLGRLAGNWYSRIDNKMKITRKIKPD